jgi:hypothetical protein
VPVPVPLPDFWEPTEPSRSTTRESGPANPGRLASEPLHPCLLPRVVRVPVPVPLPDFSEDLAGLKTPLARAGSLLREQPQDRHPHGDAGLDLIEDHALRTGGAGGMGPGTGGAGGV